MEIARQDEVKNLMKRIKKKLIDKEMTWNELAKTTGYSPWGLRNAINKLQPKALDKIENVLF